MSTIVFDFDGTLIKGDSLTKVFFNACGRSYYKKAIYILLKVLSKFNIITVSQEKELAIEFLFKNDKNAFVSACQEIVKSLRPTEVMDILNKAIKDGDKVIVLSASAEYLLNEFFIGKDIEIIAAKFKVDSNNKIYAISQHPYGRKKISTLKEHGYNHIDKCYFDSESDKCLAEICEQCFLVKP